MRYGQRPVELLDDTAERLVAWSVVVLAGHNLLFMGQLDAALDCAAQGFAVGEELGDRRLQSYAAWNLAWFGATRGDGGAAVGWGQRSIELSPDALDRNDRHFPPK